MPKLSRDGNARAAPSLLVVADEAEEGGETVYRDQIHARTVPPPLVFWLI